MYLQRMQKRQPKLYSDNKNIQAFMKPWLTRENVNLQYRILKSKTIIKIYNGNFFRYDLYEEKS